MGMGRQEEKSEILVNTEGHRASLDAKYFAK
jgi:hypothetical protein